MKTYQKVLAWIGIIFLYVISVEMIAQGLIVSSLVATPYLLVGFVALAGAIVSTVFFVKRLKREKNKPDSKDK